MLQQTKRATRIALGAVLILVGIVLSLPFVPGPGFVLIFFGLGLLSHEFEWARRLRNQMRHGFRRLTGRERAMDQEKALLEKLRQNKNDAEA